MSIGASRGRRWAVGAAAGAVLLAGLAAGGLHLAARALQSRVVSALGPRASLEAVRLDWGSVELQGLRIAADPARRDWPGADELRAASVRIRPEFGSVFTALRGHGPWRIARIDVEQGRLTLLRSHDGKLHLLPALLEDRRTSPGATDPASAASTAASAPQGDVPLRIDDIRLTGATITLTDASLRAAKPHTLTLDALQAQIGPLKLPALDEPVRLSLQALLKGPSRDGQARLQGTLTPATLDTTLAADFQGVELAALQPYLFKSGEGGIRRGTLDLHLDAQVRDRMLHAPGELTLTHLELAPGDGLLGGLGGHARQAAIDAMARDGRIRVAFKLEGRLDDPGFSLNENLLTRVTSGLADSLGVSLQGVVQGMGKLVKGLLGR